MIHKHIAIVWLKMLQLKRMSKLTFIIDVFVLWDEFLYEVVPL